MWASRGWLQCGVNLLRPMRPGEKHGVDYFFVSKEQFEAWIEEGELCEWAMVYGEYKGIPKSQVWLPLVWKLHRGPFEATATRL